jgi:hypothetical protein
MLWRKVVPDGCSLREVICEAMARLWRSMDEIDEIKRITALMKFGEAGIEDTCKPANPYSCISVLRIDITVDLPVEHGWRLL